MDPAVVHGAFGYFHPGLIAKMWTTASERIAPREAARLYHRCAHELGRSTLAEVDDLDGFVDAATQIIGAVEGASLPLFTAMRAEPVPTDDPAAAMPQAMVLRELRGSVHLLSLVAQGLDSAKAHAIKRPDDVTVFGYETTPDVTDDDRATWQRAENMTDDLLVPAYASLTDAQAASVVAGTAAIAAALGV